MFASKVLIEPDSHMNINITLIFDMTQSGEVRGYQKVIREQFPGDKKH